MPDLSDLSRAWSSPNDDIDIRNLARKILDHQFTDKEGESPACSRTAIPDLKVLMQAIDREIKGRANKQHTGAIRFAFCRIETAPTFIVPNGIGLIFDHCTAPNGLQLFGNVNSLQLVGTLLDIDSGGLINRFSADGIADGEPTTTISAHKLAIETRQSGHDTAIILFASKHLTIKHATQLIVDASARLIKAATDINSSNLIGDGVSVLIPECGKCSISLQESTVRGNFLSSSGSINIKSLRNTRVTGSILVAGGTGRLNLADAKIDGRLSLLSGRIASLDLSRTDILDGIDFSYSIIEEMKLRTTVIRGEVKGVYSGGGDIKRDEDSAYLCAPTYIDSSVLAVTRFIRKSLGLATHGRLAPHNPLGWAFLRWVSALKLTGASYIAFVLLISYLSFAAWFNDTAPKVREQSAQRMHETAEQLPEFAGMEDRAHSTVSAIDALAMRIDELPISSTMIWQT